MTELVTMKVDAETHRLLKLVAQAEKRTLQGQMAWIAYREYISVFGEKPAPQPISNGEKVAG